MKKKINIEGMSCGHCVKHVNNALTEVEGVKSVDVNLEGKYALIEAEGVTNEAIKFVIEDAGYEVVGIEEM
jgi:copper chaperone